MNRVTRDLVRIICYAVVVGALATPYILNAYKFINCDFEADYKCEVIHGVGVIVPPSSYVTAWFSSDPTGA